MSQVRSPESFVTPEAVSLSIDVAGLGSRMIAALIDTAIQLGAGIGFGFVFGAIAGSVEGNGGARTALLVIGILAYFVLIWGYYPLFEAVWKGRTPGKRAQRLRVVRTDGQPVTLGPVLVRNLLRVVDFLPAYYMVGAISMILSRRSQRVGDLAAGTIVIRERPMPAPAPLSLAPSEWVHHTATLVDPAGLTEREYGLIRSFLERRATLDPAARQAMSSRLADAFRMRLGPGPPGVDSEAYLAALAQSYRARFAPSSPGTSTPVPALPPPIPPPP